MIETYIIDLLLASFLGFLIGLERAIKDKHASIRTFSLISSGSCLFSIISLVVANQFAVSGSNPVDVGRIAAQIVSGIGFLGGGVIFKTGDRLEGITTGAMIWFSAAIGMACGFQLRMLAIIAFVFYYFILLIGELVHKILNKRIKSE